MSVSDLFVSLLPFPLLCVFCSLSLSLSLSLIVHLCVLLCACMSDYVCLYVSCLLSACESAVHGMHLNILSSRHWSGHPSKVDFFREG